jgi:hypothetical protein
LRTQCSADARVWAALALCACAVLTRRAIAGPPFQTDDPDPVPLDHYEFYVFSGTDGTPVESDPVGPAFEFNWGALPNIQLHGVISFGASIPADGPVTYGLLDTEIGVKYRFITETATRPEVGVFPMAELPTGKASRGLGVGHTWYRLPVWIQKDWGPWTTYGGGGYEVVHQPGFRSFSFAGWLLQRDVGEKWTLGGEFWYHGAEGPLTPQRRHSTMIDLGGYYYFRKPASQLLFAVGHTAFGQPETYAYLGLYRTWGGQGK